MCCQVLFSNTLRHLLFQETLILLRVLLLFNLTLSHSLMLITELKLSFRSVIIVLSSCLGLRLKLLIAHKLIAKALIRGCHSVLVPQSALSICSFHLGCGFLHVPRITRAPLTLFLFLKRVSQQ